MAAEDTLNTWNPHNNQPPSTNFATIDIRNIHILLDFDDTTNVSAIFPGLMPKHYTAAAAVDVFIHYATSSALTGQLIWDVQFERIGDQQQDLDSDGFAAVRSVTVAAVPGTSGLVDIVKISFTAAQMDSIIAGDSFRLKITRDAAGETSGASGDIELLKLELREAA